MFTIDKLLQPATVAEAAEILTEFPDVVVLGGCGFLKMGSRRISKAMDLSKCGLGSVSESDESIRIGAMASLHDLEINQALNRLFDGMIRQATGNILGTQFRRCATVGASVYSKYGFSDLIPCLLVLDTEVELIKNGRMPLKEFLEKPVARDVLTWVTIKKDARRASYQCLRNACADFAILNAAVSRFGDQWTIVAGARPSRAQIAATASARLSGKAEDIDVDDVAAAAEQELSFGSNNKASETYRRAMCRILVKRAVGEVLSCK